MRVLVCVKRVPAPGARINITADGQAVDTAFLGFTTSPHEECAVEAAVQLVEANGGDATVLTLGPARGRGAVALRGERRHRPAPCSSPIEGDVDPQRDGAAITAAVARPRGADGPFDLILFGNESADSGGFQVGVRVAHGARPPDGQRRQAPGHRRRGRCRRAARADAGRASTSCRCPRWWRQGGHQPAPLPDAEGPPGVEEGRGRAHRGADRLPVASRCSSCAHPPSRRRRRP